MRQPVRLAAFVQCLVLGCALAHVRCSLDLPPPRLRPADGRIPGPDTAFGLDAASSTSCAPWSEGWPLAAPVPLQELNGPLQEGDPRLSYDGLTFFFSVKDGDKPWDGRVATRNSVDEPFGAPQPNPLLSTDHDDTGFMVSSDGRFAVFSSNRPPARRADIWLVERRDTTMPFEASAAKVLEAASSPADDWDPHFSRDGLEIFFARSDEDDGAIWVVRRDALDAPFGPAVPVEGLDSELVESNPTISSDGRAIVFSSARKATQDNDLDLWYAVRRARSAPFSPPIQLSVVNSPAKENEPFISADGCALYFASNRSGVEGRADLFVSRVR